MTDAVHLAMEAVSDTSKTTTRKIIAWYVSQSNNAALSHTAAIAVERHLKSLSTKSRVKEFRRYVMGEITHDVNVSDGFTHTCLVRTLCVARQGSDFLIQAVEMTPVPFTEVACDASRIDDVRNVRRISHMMAERTFIVTEKYTSALEPGLTTTTCRVECQVDGIAARAQLRMFLDKIMAVVRSCHSLPDAPPIAAVDASDEERHGLIA